MKTMTLTYEACGLFGHLAADISYDSSHAQGSCNAASDRARISSCKILRSCFSVSSVPHPGVPSSGFGQCVLYQHVPVMASEIS